MPNICKFATRMSTPRYILLLIALIPFFAKGQFHNLAVEAAFHRGFLLPHRQNMLHLPDGPANALELRLYHRTDGSREWHRNFQSPSVGLTIRGFDLSNREVLGYGLAAAPFFSAPLVQSTRFQWNIEIAAGLGYISKPFDFENNYKDIAIGSYLNTFILLGQRFAYRVSQQVNVSCSMSFNHFSNAAFSLPNLGLNYPMVSLGVGWTPHPAPDTASLNKAAIPKVKSNWLLALTFGLKETFHPRKVKYPTFTFMADRQFGISRKSSIATGIDVFYNAALMANREADSISVAPVENIQLGGRVNYQLHIDRLVVLLGMGVYVRDTYKSDGRLYHRAGIRYYLSDHWGVNLSLKTHFFKADFFEFGLTYKF